MFHQTRLPNNLDNKLKLAKTTLFSCMKFYEHYFFVLLRIRKIIQNVSNLNCHLLSVKNTMGCLSYYPDRNHIGYEIWVSSLNH